MIIVFIGAGNLATRLSLEMHRAGMTIGQVYSRTLEHAQQLARKIGADATDQLNEIRTDADIYIFALKDAVLEEVISKMTPNKGLWVHTAGSMPMDIFKGYVERYGVLYPFQTFSKGKSVVFDEVPFLLESHHEKDAKILKRIANSSTTDVRFLDSEKRKYVHLSGVYACNFVNHMYVLASKILEEQQIPSDILLPLITETAEKIRTLPPVAAQTGPAVRYDENVMNKHLALLEDTCMKDIYLMLSKSIYKTVTNE
jgi:predicted short-subunit dehydrogenase-like oxidoreductase (DUF2520 family)